MKSYHNAPHHAAHLFHNVLPNKGQQDRQHISNDATGIEFQTANLPRTCLIILFYCDYWAVRYFLIDRHWS